MPAHPTAPRGVSEFTGVAILVGVTVLVTASVGLAVLVDDPGSEGPKQANFSFQYIDGSSVLIVTHDRGDTFDAGNLTLRAGSNEVMWWELAGTNETTPVAPGDTIQLSRNNAYGNAVSRSDRVKVVYAPPVGNETVLDTWDGT